VTAWKRATRLLVAVITRKVFLSQSKSQRQLSGTFIHEPNPVLSGHADVLAFHVFNFLGFLEIQTQSSWTQWACTVWGQRKCDNIVVKGARADASLRPHVLVLWTLQQF
jgi:hypothetical protein